MKRTVIYTLCGLWVAASTIAFSQDPAVKSGKKPASSAKPSASAPTTPSRSAAVDPVCKMAVASNVPDTVTYAGKHYGFCSKRCRERFQKHPIVYIR